MAGRGTKREVKGVPRPLVGPGQKSGRGFPYEQQKQVIAFIRDPMP